MNSGAIGAGVTGGGRHRWHRKRGRHHPAAAERYRWDRPGAFDPSVSVGFSFDRVTSPLNSVVVSGIPTTTSNATALSLSYAQAFTNGASYSVSFSGLRQDTTQQIRFSIPT
ncbi:MAG: hypothetical protein WDO73_01360 [Ignavibacteriota bacterium]